jgi:hypothetical protein
MRWGSERLGLKPLRRFGLEAGDVCVDPDPHEVQQIAVLNPLILGRSSAFQADLTVGYA